MTWDSERQRFTRRPFHVVEIDYERCSLTYGTAPCTAAVGVTGADRCYNGRATCQDADNIDLVPATVRFCSAVSDMPRNVLALPFLKSVSPSPTRIDPGASLGRRAELTVEFEDAPHHDVGFDPYVALRSYTPMRRGSFWGKFLARSPYYLGRALRWYSGYLSPTGAYDLSNFQVRHYVIERVDGPDANGRVRVVAKDPLKLADDDRAQAPRPSTGRLLADISNVATSATLTPTGVGALEYPASGKVRIGSEVCAFTRSGDVLTLTRGQHNTIADAHSEDDAVQLCLEYSSEPVQDIVYDLLTNYTTIDAAFLPKADWDAEADLFLNRLYGALITEPTGVNALIGELVEQISFYIWWDERYQQVRLRALKAPDPGAPVLTDAANFVEGSVTPSDKPDQRVSQTWVYYGQIDPTEKLDKTSNYRRLYVMQNVDAESAAKFGQPAIRRVYSRWINEFNEPAAQSLSEQINARYAEVPKALRFRLDARHADVWTGDVFRSQTRYVQDASGAAAALTFQVLSARERNGIYEYEAQQFSYVPPEGDGTRRIIIGSDVRDVNLRTLHDLIYAAPTGVEVIEFVISPGVVVGQSAAAQAVITGSWPGGQPITLINSGRIQGRGGDGGNQFDLGMPSEPGEDGGTALRADVAITVDNQGGIWGGGGGGAAGSSGSFPAYGGGGGAGDLPGAGGTGVAGDGDSGTRTAGGTGYPPPGPGSASGDGGDPGEAGGSSGAIAGGAAGYAVIGNSNITWTNTGDRLGPIS